MSNVETTTAAQGSPFWRFSLGYYRGPGIAEGCLELQDKCGIDVNVLLFLLWMASQKRRLPVDEVRALVEKVRRWQAEVVAPIRTLRRRLKTDAPLVEKGTAELFRTKVKALELESERLQQATMYALSQEMKFEPASSSHEAARANIAAYESVAGRQLTKSAVDVLIDALPAEKCRKIGREKR